MMYITNMNRIFTIILFLAVALGVCGRSYSVSEIPNVHLADSTRYVSNPDGILTDAEVARIDDMMRNIRRTSTAEAVVVVVDDIEGGDIDDFATELFGAWGLGKSDVDNGLLILVAKDLRRAAIRPGYGLEGVLPDIVCGRILRELMFPKFREGEYGAGLESASEAIEGILTNPDAVAEILSDEPDADRRSAEGEGMSIVTVYAIIGCVLAVIMLIVFLLMLHGLKGRSAHEKYVRLEGLKTAFLALTLLGIGIPLVASLPLVIVLRRLRNMPHKCPACGTSMKKVDEVHDNEYLSPLQDLEEQVGSVDYDVWLCPSCGEKDIEQYVQKGSPYIECEHCHARTARLERTRILRQATSTSEGRGVKEHRCANCGHITPVLFTLPVVATPIVIGGGGRGFGGGGFGGGGFGGGMTGGGGASGGW